MKTIALVLFCAILGLVPSFSYAADAKKGSAVPKNEILEAAQEFTEGFDEASQRHFGVLYGNYNMIKVVESVQESVEGAVEACGDKNPDLKVSLETRFDEWKKAVKPVIEDARANIQNMILAQDYSKPRNIKKFFRKIDKARKAKDKDVEKIPVTSLEGCEKLLKNMDATQPNMVKLLQATLISLPQVMQAEDDEARIKMEEAAAVKKAEEEAKDLGVEEEEEP